MCSMDNRKYKRIPATPAGEQVRTVPTVPTVPLAKNSPAGEQVRTVPTASLEKNSKVFWFKEEEQEHLQSFKQGRETIGV